jgi:hypothetical protein
METPLTESTIEIPPKDESSKQSITLPQQPEPASTSESSTTTEVLPAEDKINEQITSRENESLVQFLPPNTFAQISPRCYLFPGAEVTMDNMDGDSDDSDDEFSEEDEEEENEESPSNANEIIVPDIENGLSNDQVPVPEASPTLTTVTTTSSLSPLSSSQLQCNDQEIVENISDIQANDATSASADTNLDDEPTPVKRIRLEENSSEKIF